MIHLELADKVIIIIFLAILFIVPFYKTKFQNPFKISGKLPFWLGSASLLVIYWNPSIDMVNTKIVMEKGYSGLWFLKDILFTIGIAPVLFVPMWARLNLINDNQFILLRYSGKSARILYFFRSIYVGLFISAFIGSFYLLGIKKIIEIFIPITSQEFVLFAVPVIILIVLKNSLTQKIKTDFIVGVLYLVLPTIAIIYIILSHGGWGNMQVQLMQHHASKIELIPSGGLGQETVSNLIVFVMVQWWSVRILDHSNANTQRYFAIGNPWEAFKAIFIPVIIIALMFGVSSFVWDAALLSGASSDAEGLFIKLMVAAVPTGIKGLLVLTFVLGFITTWEAIINWGASFITVDIIQFNLSKPLSETALKRTGYIIMAAVGLLSLLIAANSEFLTGLKYFLFSVSAGVGPVHILRWFWWRVNAWSQLAAMLSSLIYTLIYDTLYDYSDWFHLIIENTQAIYKFDYYPLKLIVLTILVTATWLIVTFLTPPDNINKLKSFAKQTKTGGVWPFPTTDFFWLKKLLLIILFAGVGILPLWFIWEIKFGSLFFAGIYFISWLSALLIIYKKMKFILR